MNNISLNTIHLNGSSGGGGGNAKATREQYEMRALVPKTAVVQTASGTANVAVHKNFRIALSDGTTQSVAERNAAWVKNGKKTAGLPTPIGFEMSAEGEKVIFDFGYQGYTYDILGLTPLNNSAVANTLNHSHYAINAMPTAAGTGTDTASGRKWEVKEEGDRLRFISYCADGKTILWQGDCPKIATAFINAWEYDDWKERTEYLVCFGEWMRWRFAKKVTLSSNGTYTRDAQFLAVVNASGDTPAVGEDMYFDIKGVSTKVQAKYNTCNVHGATTMLVTQAIADSFYNTQKANGIHMNAGFNEQTSASGKNCVVEGALGAECALGEDKTLYIATPIITRPTTAPTSAWGEYNVPDTPAASYVMEKGMFLPSERLLVHVKCNRTTIINGLVNYLRNTEGISSIPTFPSGYTWTAFRSNASSAWCVILGNGGVYYGGTFYRYTVLGCVPSAL